MKIDLYAPKKLYGSHFTAFFGYIIFLSFLYWFPFGQSYCVPGNGEIFAFFVLPMLLVLYLVLIVIFLIDWLAKTRVKTKFFLYNIFYDIFFDAGIVLMLTPFFWFVMSCNMSIKNISSLVLIFLLIRGLKRNQRIREKQQKS